MLSSSLAIACLVFGGLVSYHNAVPVLNPSANNTAGRTAVLKEYALTGVRNVRWETTPMVYVDSEGKPIAADKMGSNKPGGMSGCVDILGKSQSEGVEYERANGKFKYRCNNGVEEVVACVGSDRTNKARIEVGKTLDVNGLWHKCERHPNNSVIYTQEPTCSHGGKEYRAGDEVLVGYLRLQCQENGYKVMGCFYMDDNNKPVSMNAGDKQEAGKVTHFCEGHDDQLQYFSKRVGCNKQGKEYKEDEIFNQNHLHYKCSNGLADVTGCFINETRDLAIGQDVVENNMVYRCYRLGGSIEYSEYACGFNGTPSCKPEPVPQASEDVPMGKSQSPGFNTFAVVQRVGESGVVPHPPTLNLQLDKLSMGVGQ